ncbi:MAG: nitroreductase family deazaflavin-dependent oxidoreductase [Chloroflexi bacterium]|nr:MAG: nitroreductase family deazaflavin-dependent oxidoreductase [Chloroflexota bacterium]
MSSSFLDFNRNLIKDLRAHGGKATDGPFQGRDVLILTTKGARGEKFNARAKVIEGEDYERLYKQHADINPGFWDYRKKTSRKIPVIVLERLDS